MAFTEQDIAILKQAKAQGKTKEQALAALVQSRQATPVVTKTNSTFQQGMEQDRLQMGSSINTALQEGTENRQRIRERVEQGEITPVRGTVQTLGRGLQTGFRVLGEPAIGLAKMALPESVQTRIKETLGADIAKISDPAKREAFIEKLGSSEFEADKKAAQALTDLSTKYKTDETFRDDVNAAGGFAEAIGSMVGLDTAKTALKTRQLTPELDTPYFQATEQAVAEAIDATKKVTENARGTAAGIKPPVAETLSPSLGEKAIDVALMGAQKTAQTYRDLVDSAQTRIVRNLDNQAIRENAKLALPDVEQNIQQMYVNAVSPGVKGKKVTTEGITANKEQAVKAVKGLTLNKKDITFRDIETNQIVTGELPSNLWEFGGAVTDRKSKVYQQVLKEIGKASTDPVDTSRIADAMMDIIDNPVYAGESAIVNRARQALEKYSLTEYTPMQLEDLIKLENDKLQAFYRGSGNQGDAIVSAIVANNLRDMLDEAVEAATGSRVRPLKQEYGNLKAIERDVVHRALHNAQARDAGLVDMFGIRTIGDVSAGLAGDMGALRRGAGQIVGEGFIKALNDRDAMINRMFMVADQAYTTQ